jgi:hypothetical protein
MPREKSSIVVCLSLVSHYVKILTIFLLVLKYCNFISCLVITSCIHVIILYFNMIFACMKLVIMRKKYTTLIVTIEYCCSWLDLFNILEELLDPYCTFNTFNSGYILYFYIRHGYNRFTFTSPTDSWNIFIFK